jgi:hypothetical protein
MTRKLDEMNEETEVNISNFEMKFRSCGIEIADSSES